MSQKLLKPEIVQEILEDAWMNVGYIGDQLFNPLENIPDELIYDPQKYYMWLLSQPEYFPLFCKEILNFEMFPFQSLIIEELWHRRFPILIGSRGASKSMCLGLFALLRMLFIPERKIVLTGAGFRQSKIVFEYIEKFWYNSPLLRDLVGGGHQENGPFHGTDMWRFKIANSTTMALPIGDGTKIRGIRAHDIIVDEFASGNPEIFEHVIAGFSVVASEPMEKHKIHAKNNMVSVLNSIGYKLKEKEDNKSGYQPNHIILAGTAYHSYNHFFKYWNKNRDIIYSNGDKRRLAELGADDVNPEDYSVIRLPYDLLPSGLMEEEIILRAKSNMHESLHLQEFGACFTDDTNGFFKRSLLESCIGDHTVLTYGRKGKEYVIAVDPASEMDNFCVVIIEVSEKGKKIVYCWTTNKKAYKEKLKRGKTSIDDFYEYAARHILDLVNYFNVIGIAIDTQGGGHAIISLLHKASLINKERGEQPLWAFEDRSDPKEEDGEEGRHIIELVNFADAEYTSSANHGLRLDFEQKNIKFPFFDAITFAEIDLSDEKSVQECDMIEGIVIEIEEMKNELSSIVQTQTASGRDKWDTPDQKMPGSKKGRMKKDRYSALLMANALANKLRERKPELKFDVGGFAAIAPSNSTEKPTYNGSSLAKKLSKFYENI